MWGEKEGGIDSERISPQSVTRWHPGVESLTRDSWPQSSRTSSSKKPGQAHPPKYGCCSGEGVIICQTLWYTWHAEIYSEFPAIKVWLIPWPRELWLGQVQREGFIHKSRKEGLQKVRGSKVTMSWETKLNFFRVIFDGVWKFSSWLQWQKCNFIQNRWWSGEMWRTIYLKHPWSIPLRNLFFRYLILKILILSSSDIGSAFHFTAGGFWPAH